MLAGSPTLLLQSADAFKDFVATLLASRLVESVGDLLRSYFERRARSLHHRRFLRLSSFRMAVKANFLAIFADLLL